MSLQANNIEKKFKTPLGIIRVRNYQCWDQKCFRSQEI